MIAARIAEEFLKPAAADSDFDGVSCVVSQNSSPVELPRIVVSAKWSPLNGSSNVGRAEVLFAVEDHAGDGTELAPSEAIHQAHVALVYAKYFGADEATAKDTRAALAQSISLMGVVEVDPRYLPVGDFETARSGDRFRTVLRLKAGVMIL